jgi:hypothetical protein
MSRSFSAPGHNRRSVSTLSRRGFLAATSGASALLAGCGSGVLSGSSGPARGRAAFVVNPETAPLTTDDGRAINFLATVTNLNGTTTILWGTKTAGGLPDKILQSLFITSDPGEGARTTYDLNGLPIMVRHENNGAFITLTWEAARLILKLYRPNGEFLGAGEVTRDGAGFKATAFPGTALVGTFIGTLANATGGIISFTIGTSTRLSSSKKQARTRRSAAGRAVADAKEVVRALSAPLRNASQFARDFLAAHAADLDNSSATPLLSRLLTQIMGASPSPPFIGGGKPLVGGVAAPLLLEQATAEILQRIDAGQDPTRDNTLGVAVDSPPPTDYVGSSLLATPQTRGDSTALFGVAAAREFGTISVSGIIDAQNNVTLTGTGPTGNRITLTGQVVNDQVRGGAWSFTSGRDGSGSWDADQRPLGVCRQQQNSGGQGLFTNTYDLTQSCGTVQFQYQAFSIPDQFEVIYNGRTVLNTGMISGGGVLNIDLDGGDSPFLIVIVTASNSGTAWNYTVGCPTL